MPAFLSALIYSLWLPDRVWFWRIVLNSSTCPFFFSRFQVSPSWWGLVYEVHMHRLCYLCASHSSKHWSAPVSCCNSAVIVDMWQSVKKNMLYPQNLRWSAYPLGNAGWFQSLHAIPPLHASKRKWQRQHKIIWLLFSSIWKWGMPVVWALAAVSTLRLVGLGAMKYPLLVVRREDMIHILGGLLSWLLSKGQVKICTLGTATGPNNSWSVCSNRHGMASSMIGGDGVIGAVLSAVVGFWCAAWAAVPFVVLSKRSPDLWHGGLSCLQHPCDLLAPVFSWQTHRL